MPTISSVMSEVFVVVFCEVRHLLTPRVSRLPDEHFCAEEARAAV